MPLSQGCNVRTATPRSPASKQQRAAFKPPRPSASERPDEPTKRSKLSENVLLAHSAASAAAQQHLPHTQQHLPHTQQPHQQQQQQTPHPIKTLNSLAYSPPPSPHYRQHAYASSPLKARLSAANSLQLSFLFGDSLARCGRLAEAFDVYALIASEHYEGLVPFDRLHTLATALIEYVRKLSAAATSATSGFEAPPKKSAYDPPESPLKMRYAAWQLQNGSPLGGRPAAASLLSSAGASEHDSVLDADGLESLHAPTRELGGGNGSSGMRMTALMESPDPLMCPLCQDILRCPVTTNCGHTFCRQCCETITMCHICHVKFPRFPHLDEFVNQAGEASASGTPATPPPNAATFLTSGAAAATSTFDSAARLTLPWRGLLSSASASGSSGLSGSPSSIPITTTTVASTTATATTTMAATAPRDTGTAASTYSSRPSITVTVSPSPPVKFMPDVQVRRLVEKWWGPDLQAKKINETAASYMHLNLLDEALKFCNASLEKSPTNFKSLLLRAEVLRKLNHYQSSLADVDNALKTRYTSAKAHYLRALALSELGRADDALYDNCLAIGLDKTTNLTTTELFQHDLTKNLQKLLAHSSKSKAFDASHRTFVSTAPYSILPEPRRRRKQISLLSDANSDHYSLAQSPLALALMGGGEDEEDVDVEEAAAAVVGQADLYVPYMVGKQCDFAGDEAVILSDSITGALELSERQRITYVRRQTSRKHFRRKCYAASEQQQLEEAGGRCSPQFCAVLERVQQELRRLKKLESSEGSEQLVPVAANLIDASDFDCVLCCRTFWKPVVTPCGHTYCLVCLDRCMDYTSSCPLCKSPLVEPPSAVAPLLGGGSVSPVPFVLAKRPVTKFLEAAMRRFIPDSYAKRFRQEIDMEPSVPVFICTTAFPHVPCPLFVYEQRYRLMVRRAVESGEKQFGIVQPQSGKSRYFDVGTILDIRDCVLLGDGCSILSTIGCKRFKILARNEKDGYETAKVEYIYDETIPDESVPYVSNMHAAVLAKAVDWFDSLRTESKQEILQSFGAMPRVEENWETIADGPAWAWWIIALLPLSQQLKVDILATTSLEKRLRAIEKTLDYITFRRAQQECSVVVVQQQQHQHQQHQHQQQQQLQQQQQCDNAELSHTDECCVRSSSSAISADGDEAHAHAQHASSEQHLLL